MPEVQAQVHDAAASLSAEILEALMDDVQGAVRQNGPPALLEMVDTSSATEGESVGMVVKTYQDAGVVPIYDIETGAMSLTSVNMLPAQLRKLNAEGKRMFTHRPPVQPPVQGELKCWLHPDNPARSEYDRLGLPTCHKANLPSPYQVEQHMRRRHPTAYETVERIRQERERAEDREWQRQIAMAAARQQATRTKEDEAATNETAAPEADTAPVKRGPFGRPVKQA